MLVEAMPLVAYLDTGGYLQDERDGLRWVSPRIHEQTGYTQEEWQAEHR